MEVNKELFKEVDGLLKPLFIKVLNYESIEEQVRILEELLPKLLNKSLDVLKLYGIFNKTYKKMIYTQNFASNFDVEVFEIQEITHLLIYEYLLLSEGMLAKQIDLICYLLVESGLKFEYKEKGKMRYTKSILKIQKSYLTNKLTFLDKNNFNLINKYYNNELRNAIAHINFNIDEEGDVILKNNKISFDDMNKLSKNLLDLVVCINKSFNKYYKEYIDNYPYKS
jgi:hypothetical protein